LKLSSIAAFASIKGVVSMLTLGHDCPHCLRERIAFTAHGQSVRNPQDSRLWSTLFTCNGCFGPLLVVAASAAGGVSPTSHSGALENMSGYKIASAYPPGPMIEVPEHLPDAVDQAFREGCMNVKRAPSLACVGFRRTRNWPQGAVTRHRRLETGAPNRPNDRAGPTHKRPERLGASATP